MGAEGTVAGEAGLRSRGTAAGVKPRAQASRIQDRRVWCRPELAGRGGAGAPWRLEAWRCHRFGGEHHWFRVSSPGLGGWAGVRGVGGSVGRETGPGDCAGVYWHRWVGKEWPRKEPEENRDMRTQEREVSGAGGRAVSGGGGVAWAPASEKLSSLKTTPHPGCVPRAHQWP